jgi:hypothetical protein
VFAAAAAATGILSLYGTPALADSFAGGGAEDSPGVLSGNNVQAPVHVPVNACGNTATGVGAFNSASDNTCVNESGGHGEKAGGATAVGGAEGSPGVLSGNNVQAPVHAPVNACGNDVTVGGVLTAGGSGLSFSGVFSGSFSSWPDSLTQVLSLASLNSPTRLTLLPQAFTGTWTGAWMRLPDSRPGEPLAAPTAWAPPLSECEAPEEASWWEWAERSEDFFSPCEPPETLAQVLSEALLKPPPTVTSLPHASTSL